MKTTLMDSAPEFERAAGEQRYLLLDGAQIKQLGRQVCGLGGKDSPQPLYATAAYHGLLDVSPYLIVATPAATQWFLELNQPTAGFFFASTQPEHAVVEQLRHLIQVASPAGSMIYLKMAHSECAYELLNYGIAELWQCMTRAWLPTRMGWKTLSHPEVVTPRSEGLLKLSDPLWQRLSQIGWRDTLTSLEQHMRTNFPERLPASEASVNWVEHYVKQAEQTGLNTQSELTRYFNILGLLGDTAFESDHYPELHRLLHTPSALPHTQRMAQALQLAEQYATAPSHKERGA